MLMFLFVSYAKRQNMHGTQNTIYYFKYVRTHSYAGTTFGVFSIIPDGSWIACCAVQYQDRRHRLQQRVFYSIDTDNRVANEACPNERAFSHQ